jgi:hypothetical protein
LKKSNDDCKSHEPTVAHRRKGIGIIRSVAETDRPLFVELMGGPGKLSGLSGKKINRCITTNRKVGHKAALKKLVVSCQKSIEPIGGADTKTDTKRVKKGINWLR